MFNKYLSDDENIVYLKSINGYADLGTKNRSREKQTLENVLNQSLYDLYSQDIYFMTLDNSEIYEFKNHTHNEQLSILKHILRIQAYSIIKAIEYKATVILPLLGRLVYNKYRNLAIKIYGTFNKIENGVIINELIKSIIKDLMQSERRNKRIYRLSIRKDVPYLQLEDFINKNRSYVNERYTTLKQN